MINKNIYHLVLELKPGNFMPIDINILTNDNNNYNTIEQIDSFTKKYTNIELLELIKNNNIVPFEYLNGKLHIINSHKYRYEVLYKDTNFSLDDFFINNIKDKQKMNKFVNIYLKYSKDNINILKDAINNEDIYSILNLLFMLSYENVRNIYTYMLNHI